MRKSRSRRSAFLQRDVVLWIAALVIQAMAAGYFILDSFDDFVAQLRAGPDLELVLELVVALALLLAVALGARQLRLSLEQSRRTEVALAVARGMTADLLSARFNDWRLSPAEAEVALFALKGMTIAEIADLRSSAEGTIRSQLSQVYAKAGVTSQSMLIAQFIEDLI